MAQAYDGHMNMVLSDVEETITVVTTAENGAPTLQVRHAILFQTLGRVQAPV